MLVLYRSHITCVHLYQCILMVAYLMKFNTTSLMNPLLGHWSTQSMAHPPITTASPVPLEGVITSTWSLRLRMDFEILSSPLFSSKMEVGTDAGSYLNTSFRLIALVLINAVTHANVNPESHCSNGSDSHCFLPSFMVITSLRIVWLNPGGQADSTSCSWTSPI